MKLFLTLKTKNTLITLCSIPLLKECVAFSVREDIQDHSKHTPLIFWLAYSQIPRAQLGRMMNSLCRYTVYTATHSLQQA